MALFPRAKTKMGTAREPTLLCVVLYAVEGAAAEALKVPEMAWMGWVP